MRITNKIPNIDLLKYLTSNKSFKRYQYLPDTNNLKAKEDRPIEMFLPIKDEKLFTFIDVEEVIDVNIEEFNLEFQTEFTTVDEVKGFVGTQILIID